MADVTTASVPVEGQAQETTQEPQITNDSINTMVDQKIETIKEFYEGKINELKKQNSGLDRRVSELTKVKTEFEKKEMTETERKALEESERKDAWNQLWQERAKAKYDFMPAEGEDIDFGDYLFGGTEDEIITKAERLKTWIDNKINTGIETGVENKIKEFGYKPQAAGHQAKDSDYENMSREELASKVKQLSSLPDGEEKTAALNNLMKEQMRRYKK